MESSEINWTAYNLGFAAWDLYIDGKEFQRNPFKALTDEWKSWNRGWNLNTNGCD